MNQNQGGNSSTPGRKGGLVMGFGGAFVIVVFAIALYYLFRTNTGTTETPQNNRNTENQDAATGMNTSDTLFAVAVALILIAGLMYTGRNMRTNATGSEGEFTRVESGLASSVGSFLSRRSSASNGAKYESAVEEDEDEDKSKPIVVEDLKSAKARMKQVLGEVGQMKDVARLYAALEFITGMTLAEYMDFTSKSLAGEQEAHSQVYQMIGDAVETMGDDFFVTSGDRQVYTTPIRNLLTQLFEQAKRGENPTPEQQASFSRLLAAYEDARKLRSRKTYVPMPKEG